MHKFVRAIAALGLSAGICLSFTGCGEKSAAPVTPSGEEGSYSIVTKLDLNIDFDGNTVKGAVKNSFTFFPATARVYVYLYFAESYTTDYTKMQEVANNYTEDLDMNKTLTATYEMQGESGYFLARMRYKIDSREWQERTTDAYKHSYSGIYMQTIEDDGSLPVFEDTEPVFTRLVPNKEYVFRNSYEVFDATIAYSKFANDYLKEFNEPLNKEFFVFSLTTNEYYDTAAPNYIEYAIFKSYETYYFSYFISLYIEEFEFAVPPTTEPTGLGFCNLGLTFVSINIEEKLNGKFRMEFGKEENDYAKEFESGFINMYIGETCIGTCHYTSYAKEKISYAFFYNMFVENLRSNFEIV